MASFLTAPLLPASTIPQNSPAITRRKNQFFPLSAPPGSAHRIPLSYLARLQERQSCRHLLHLDPRIPAPPSPDRAMRRKQPLPRWRRVGRCSCPGSSERRRNREIKKTCWRRFWGRYRECMEPRERRWMDLGQVVPARGEHRIVVRNAFMSASLFSR